jgi:TctA family transporter
MLEAASTAFTQLFSCPCYFDVVPLRIVFLVIGVVAGLALGAIPGLGGYTGLAILLPFTFDMDQTAAFALIIAMISVSNSSDSIPSILFGVPGTAASQATILDGYPMTKRGEAGRALGAAYMSSMIGGVFGALVLSASIPILRPVVLAFGPPEFFMLGLLGISMVAVLSGRVPLKGLGAAGLGLLVGMVGTDIQTGALRWTFGRLYLWDGLPLVALAIGLFGVPEMIDLLIRGKKIANVDVGSMKGVSVGVRDALRHWKLVLRSSAIGVWVGAIPGLGGSVVDWISYGQAAQTEKGARETFGTGDVRGVIAPESSNNAKEGGALIPTIAFGVPGSGGMALVLGAFLMQGLTPGPEMLTTNLSFTYTLIWSLVIANVVGTAMLLVLTRQFVKIASMRITLLAPIVIAAVFLAAYQSTRDYGDVVVLVAFSTLGWFMKRFGWPRPPVVLAFVLSGTLENQLFISINLYGASWAMRPIVLGIAVVIIGSMAYGFRSSRRGEPSTPALGTARDD